MPHVRSISSDDDDLEADEWEYREPVDTERRPVPWIPIAAAGGAVLLLIVLAFLLFGGGSGKGSSTAATTTTVAGPTTEPLAMTDPRVVTAQAAMDAWGKFEGSGKIADIGTTMDPKGPQYKALAARAGSIKPGTAPFTVVITNPRAVSGAANGDQIVRSDLVWKRAGKPDQSVTWDLVLREKADGSGLWLWTARKVTDGGASGGTVPAGEFCAAAKLAEGVPTNNDLNSRLEGISGESDKLKAIIDVLSARAAASAAMAEAAPTEIRNQATTVATGDAAYVTQLKKVTKLKDFTSADKKANNDPAYKAGLAALPEVTDYTRTKCGVNIDRGR